MKSEKKPIFKRWWFWLGFILVFGFVVGQTSDKDTETDEIEVIEEKKEEPEKEMKEKPLKNEPEEPSAVEWVSNKSKAVMDVKQHDDRLYIDIDGEAGFSIASSVKGAYNEFNWLKDIFADEDINRVTFQYMYTFVGGSKELGYSFAYDRDTHKDNQGVVFESGDVEPYLIFDKANEYDFHPDVWGEAPEEIKKGLNNEPTKIESY